MSIDFILNKLKLKIPSFAKIVEQIEFQFCNDEERIAFLQGNIIYYTIKLFSNFRDDEQLFIIAHEIMHYIKHYSKGNEENKDMALLNFVEDAQINQFLLKLGLTPPKGIVLINDALDYSEEDLYKLLLPKIALIKGWTKGLTDWKKFSFTADILNCDKFNKGGVTDIKR